MCNYVGKCGYCINFAEDADDEHQCRVFGLAIGDGSAVCGSFQCTVINCRRSICFSDDELIDDDEFGFFD